VALGGGGGSLLVEASLVEPRAHRRLQPRGNLSQPTVTQVNRGSTFVLGRSTLDFCLGGQRHEDTSTKEEENRRGETRTRRMEGLGFRV